jgi:hypothetical protein
MSIILITTIIVGLISTKSLLAFNVDDVRIRYPLVVLVSYLAFIIFIRIWLYYIKYRDKILENTLDLLDIPFNSTSNDSTVTIEQCMESGGGEFGGAGASGSFDLPGRDIVEGGASSIVDTADFIEEGALILVPLMIVLTVVFGAGIFLIYEAPIILSEVALEFILAGTLIKRAKEIDSPNWVGSAIRMTWLPFAITMVLAIGFSFVLHSMFPEINAISEILK